MENFAQSLGPLYFFDQVKTKGKKWRKGDPEGHSPLVGPTLQLNLRSTKCNKLRQLEEGLSKCSAKEEHELHSLTSPQIHPGSAGLRKAKILLKKNLFEEYKCIATEILSELEETFQIYADNNITFPMGAINLVDYNWRDLTHGIFEYSTKDLVSKKHQASHTYSKSKNKEDSKKCKVLLACSSGETLSEDNNQLQGKSTLHHHGIDNKYTGKKSLVNPEEIIQSVQDQGPVVIHFSLSSKACFEKGWIFHPPASPLEVPKGLLSIAVKKLRVIRLQIEKEENQLKKEGFTKKLILSHYPDDEGLGKVNRDFQFAPCFWLELLKKPEMPVFTRPHSKMKKFHYALIDGSSLT